MKDKLNEILIEIGKLNGKVEGIEGKLIDHDEQFENINKKLDKHDEQFEAINKKLDKHDEQFEGINKKLDEHDKQFEVINKKLDNHDKKFAGIDNKLSNMEHNQLKFDEYFKAIMHFHKERKVDINEIKVDVKDIQSEFNILTIKSSRNSIDIERIKRVNEDRKGYEED